MRLTLTREQIPLARETVAFLRSVDGEKAANQPYEQRRHCPGWQEWSDEDEPDHEWARALEAAITEAEGTQAPQPGPVSDADERAFWREAYLTARAHAVTTMAGAAQADYAAEEADRALKRYRKAFCTGMPSDQKGAK